MTCVVRHDPSLPPYARIVDHAGSPVVRWALDKVLRWSIKRRFRHDMDIDLMRRKQADLDLRMTRLDPALRITPVDAHGIACDWIDPPGSRPDRVLFYLHGGAWMFKFPRLHHAMAGALAGRLGARVLMVDYRLAPEHPYPAGLDDCHAAWHWLAARGVAARDIVIAGDSAGGNLTLAMLHRLRASGAGLPACAVALSPFVDFTLSSPSMVTNERSDPLFTAAAMVGLRHRYLRPEQMLDAEASPLFGDWAGLPPILFQSSASEMLRDDSLRAAARAHAAGVTVEVELWSHLPHVFQSMQPLAQGPAALDRIADFVRRHAAWLPPT